MGLGENVLIQGLGQKVFMPPDSTHKRTVASDTLYIEGEGWIDVKRSEELWDSVYVAQKAFVKRGSWIDRPSVTIPYLYVLSGVELAHALALQGKQSEAQRVYEGTVQVAKATGLSDITTAAASMFQPAGR
jgi:hypothetical protein